MWSPSDTTLIGLVSIVCNELLVDDEKSHDLNMASLTTFINQFLEENKFHPEYCNRLEEDMELWVVKCTELEVCLPVAGGVPD